MIIPKKKTTGVARALGGLCLKTSETTPMVTGTRRLSPAAAPHLHGSSRGSFLQRFFTANENDMRLSAGICTANIAGVANGEWGLISPYGDHPSPDGSYTQHFDRAQADKVIGSWKSLGGMAFRWFKNMAHGIISANSIPIWDGHPETDRARWPKEKRLGEITELRAGDLGLEGRITWNDRGTSARTRGPLFPSPLWWHWPPSGTPPTVFPELLESIGLVTTPNISSVPAWTANAHVVGSNPFAGDPQAENQTKNDMNPEQLLALRKALNLPETADAATIISTANAALQLTTANASLVQTKADLENQLTTANGKVTTLTADLDKIKTANTTLVTERNDLKTANATLTTEAAEARKAFLDLAEKTGAITPAERPGFETKLSTANSRAAAVSELVGGAGKPVRKAINTAHVEINGTRLDLSTANARQTALTAAVEKRMKADECDYDTAFTRVKNDPSYGALFAAMADPTRKAS